MADETQLDRIERKLDEGLSVPRDLADWLVTNHKAWVVLGGVNSSLNPMLEITQATDGLVMLIRDGHGSVVWHQTIPYSKRRMFSHA